MMRLRKIQIGVGAAALAAAVGVGYAAVSLSPTQAHATTAAGQSNDGQKFYIREATLPGAFETLRFEDMDQKDMARAFGMLAGLQEQRRGDVYSLMRGVTADSLVESLGAEETQGRRSRGRTFFGNQGLGGWTVLPQIWVQKKSGGDDLFEIEFDFDDFDFAFDFDFDFDDFDFDFDFDEGFDSAFNIQEPDVDAIIREVMAALDEAGLEGYQKLTNVQRARLKARLKERLGRLEGRSGRLQERFGRMRGRELGERIRLRFDSDDLKKQMEEMQKHLRSDDFKKMMELRGGQNREMTKEQREKLESAMKTLRERFGEGGEFQLRMKEGMAAREKAMAKMMERFGENGSFAKQMEKMQGELKIKMKDLELKMANLPKFFDSLTDQQKELAKKQGYLKWSDLTKEQQKLLGEFGKDGGSIRFSIDDNPIKITREKKKGGISA